jgi:glycosyltransferase involved in cell wall biosynthesis
MVENRVTVIIPVFNRSKRLKDAVMSVLLQSYSSIEIIIVDDGSTDDTAEVAAILLRKWPGTILVYTQNNSGPALARELGTQKSSGEFIQYLDSDDLLLPQKLELQVTAFQAHQHSEISYGISYEEDYSFEPPLVRGPMRSTGEEISYLFPKLLNERWWTTSSPLYRRSLIDKIGPWEDLINEEDWEFDAHAGSLNTLLNWVPSGLSIRRINLDHNHLSHGGCTDTNKIADRVKAKHLILKHALKSGMKKTDHEMEVFSRECLFISRQCALLDLENQAELMFRLSKKASRFFKNSRLTSVLYGVFSAIIGWKKTAEISIWIRDSLNR